MKLSFAILFVLLKFSALSQEFQISLNVEYSPYRYVTKSDQGVSYMYKNHFNVSLGKMMNFKVSERFRFELGLSAGVTLKNNQQNLLPNIYGPVVTPDIWLNDKNYYYYEVPALAIYQLGSNKFGLGYTMVKYFKKDEWKINEPALILLYHNIRLSYSRVLKKHEVGIYFLKSLNNMETHTTTGGTSSYITKEIRNTLGINYKLNWN